MAGSIYLPILSSFNPAGINAAKTSLGGLATAFDGVKRALGVASAGFVAFKAMTETIDFGRSSIVAARDLERNLNALDSVFGNLSPQMEVFARNGVDIGLSQIEAAKSSTFLGSVLKQAGFGMEDVASQTQNLVGLASDLAVTYGYDVSEALSGMTALFRGEYDPIEKFGVAMKQSEVNAVLAANGQDKLAGAARRNAEQMARLALLYQRTQDAQGAFKEGAGTLFVEQQKLQAIFNNLQAQVGKALIPALVKVAESLQPLVKTLGPVITEIFTQFAGIIAVLGQQLDKLKGSLSTVLTVFGFLFSVLKNILPFLIDNAAAIITFITVFKGITVLTPIVQGLIVQLALLRMELAAGTSVAALFGATTAASLGPLGLAAAGIAALASGLVILGVELGKAAEKTKDLDTEFNKFVKSAEKDPFKQLTASSLGYGIGLMDVIDKQKKVASFDPNAAKNQTSASRLAGQRNPTSGGLKSTTDNFQKTLDELLKNFKGAAEVDKAGESAAKKAAAKLAAQKAALAEFQKDLKQLTSALAPMPQMTREIGQFEQATVDAFDSLNKKVEQGILDDKIAKAGGQALLKYVATERAALEAISKQRDEISKKRGLAEALITDIKAAILGVGNLASLLETETRQITIATTKIVDGFVITTKRTIDEVIGGKGVLSKLNAVVAKTKAFAVQLTQLKKLGLNENLFKQIVEAGPEVGGQLATEILAGGSDSVKALNTTFKELEDVAGQVAEQTAIVMYGAGVDVAGGLVNGLLSQEAALIAAANKLADAFNAAYQSKINTLQIPAAGGNAQQTTLRLGDIKLAGEAVGASAQAQANAALAAKLINTDKFTAWGSTSTINVTVNAGAGTNGKAVGQTIQSLLNQYAKAN